MATVVSHFLLGWAGYRIVERGRDPRRLGPAVAGCLSTVPDADSLLMPWIAYSAPWGHRGMTHSLAFAAIVGIVAAALLRRRLDFPGGLAGLAATFAAVTASHGLLDALTDGGLGVAFLAPFDATRWFLPVRPIPVSPISVNLSNPWLWRVLAVEAVMLWPWALLLQTARRPVPPAVRVVSIASAVVSVVVWCVRST